MVLARTVANGCGRLRTVATVNATSSEHTLNPQTPRVKREPLLRIREKWGFKMDFKRPIKGDPQPDYQDESQPQKVFPSPLGW